MSSSVQDIFDVLSPDAANALHFLAVPPCLEDGTAEELLIKAGTANGNASALIEEIRAFPIWHEKGGKSWGLDDDVREYALSKLNGSAEGVRRAVLKALRELRQQPETLPSSVSLWEFDLQLARLSLTVEQEQPGGVAVLRQFFDLHHDETSRVVDLYMDESLPAEVPAGTLPDHLRSAYFMRGMYAYRNKRRNDALRFLEPVWKWRGSSPQSCHDAAIAAHIVGLIWSKEPKWQQDAEKAFRESLELGKDDPHHQAQVWHSLGNLLSKNRQREKEAEDAYRKSLALEERNGNTFGQVQVWHSLGNLLSKNRQRDKEGEDAYRKSLMLAQDNSYHQAQVWHSLGNLLSKNRQRDREAEDAYRKSLALEERNGNTFGQAQVWHSLGNLLSKNRTRWPEAEDVYKRSLEAAKNNIRHRVMVARSYGLLAIEQGDYDKAEKYLRIALDNERNEFYRDTIAAKLEEVARKKAGR